MLAALAHCGRCAGQNEEKKFNDSLAQCFPLGRQLTSATSLTSINCLEPQPQRAMQFPSLAETHCIRETSQMSPWLILGRPSAVYFSRECHFAARTVSRSELFHQSTRRKTLSATPRFRAEPLGMRAYYCAWPTSAESRVFRRPRRSGNHVASYALPFS